MRLIEQQNPHHDEFDFEGLSEGSGIYNLCMPAKFVLASDTSFQKSLH
jgi:hypothetical protein